LRGKKEMRGKLQLSILLMTVLLCFMGVTVFASSEEDFEFNSATGTITQILSHPLCG